MPRVACDRLGGTSLKSMLKIHSLLQPQLAYLMLVNLLSTLIPYVTVVLMLLLGLAQESNGDYWVLLTAASILIMTIWLLSVLFGELVRFIAYMVMVGILILSLPLINTDQLGMTSTLILLAGLISLRGIAAGISLAKSAFLSTVAELIGMAALMLAAVAGYIILLANTTLTVSAFELEISYALVYLVTNTLGFLITIVLLYVISIWRNAKSLQVIDNLKLLTTWSLDDEVVEDVVLNRSNIELSASNRAIVFGDIRGFTSFSESHPAVEVAEILTQMYRLVEKEVKAFNAAKPEFIADEFITYFSSSQDALDMAVSLSEKLNRFLDVFGLSVGMGIDHGEVLEGVIGGENSKKYTLIGRHVNIAARLQAQAAGSEILMTEDVYRNTSGYEAEQIEDISLKGVSAGVKIFKVTVDQNYETESDFAVMLRRLRSKLGV